MSLSWFLRLSEIFESFPTPHSTFEHQYLLLIQHVLSSNSVHFCPQTTWKVPHAKALRDFFISAFLSERSSRKKGRNKKRANGESGLSKWSVGSFPRGSRSNPFFYLNAVQGKKAEIKKSERRERTSQVVCGLFPTGIT